MERKKASDFPPELLDIFHECQHSDIVYDGTEHGFHNDIAPRYDEAAAKLAIERTLDFFNQNLRG